MRKIILHIVNGSIILSLYVACRPLPPSYQQAEYAVLRNNVKLLDKILRKEPDLATKILPDGECLIVYAGNTGKIETYEVLKKYNADINLVNKKGETALVSFLTRSGKIEVKSLRWLLDNNASCKIPIPYKEDVINSIGFQFLSQNESQNSLEILKLLVSRGINLSDHDIKYLIECADPPPPRQRNKDLYEYLIKLQSTKIEVTNSETRSAIGQPREEMEESK